MVHTFAWFNILSKVMEIWKSFYILLYIFRLKILVTVFQPVAKVPSSCDSNRHWQKKIIYNKHFRNFWILILNNLLLTNSSEQSLQLRFNPFNQTHKSLSLSLLTSSKITTDFTTFKICKNAIPLSLWETWRECDNEWRLFPSWDGILYILFRQLIKMLCRIVHFYCTALLAVYLHWVLLYLFLSLAWWLSADGCLSVDVLALSGSRRCSDVLTSVDTWTGTGTFVLGIFSFLLGHVLAIWPWMEQW